MTPRLITVKLSFFIIEILPHSKRPVAEKEGEDGECSVSAKMVTKANFHSVQY